MGRPESPTPSQVRRVIAIVEWYLTRYFRTESDNGVLDMYCDRARVGSFAVRRDSVLAGQPAALFRVLITTAMFQRQRDAQVLRILRGVPSSDARRICSQRSLLRLARLSPCECMRTSDALKTHCDLSKDPSTKLGVCTQNRDLECHLKRDTEVLRRYGYFGKVPTSIAFAVSESGGRDLRELREHVLRQATSPRDAAVRLEAALCRAFRVEKKIANMFLSVVSNPDLCGGEAPWSDGVDWSWFVVVDSNVDLFLKEIGFSGPWTYETRRRFVRSLGRKVDLSAFDNDLRPFNPRLVQQALYSFMSKSNRTLSQRDCSNEGAAVCGACSRLLRSLCPCCK